MIIRSHLRVAIIAPLTAERILHAMSPCCWYNRDSEFDEQYGAA